MNITSEKKTVPVNSIYQNPWWLDAVAPNSWDSIEVFQGGQLQARLPYAVKHKMGLTILTMPPLAQTLGPWLAPPATANYSKQISHQNELMELLIEQMPQHDYFTAKFHYSITNWLPFYWRGFSQSSRYTYVLEDLTDLDLVFSNFRDHIRRDIRKAQKQVVVRTDLDVDRLLDIISLTFERQGKPLSYDRELVKRLNDACIKRQACCSFYAEDSQGRIHAAIWIAWDENSAYFLLSGGDPELRNSGATSLLVWEAIQFASKVTRKFDFEGSMIKPIEQFLRGFGGRQISYFQVSHMSQRMKLLTAGRDMFKAFL